MRGFYFSIWLDLTWAASWWASVGAVGCFTVFTCLHNNKNRMTKIYKKNTLMKTAGKNSGQLVDECRRGMENTDRKKEKGKMQRKTETRKRAEWQNYRETIRWLVGEQMSARQVVPCIHLL